MGILYLRPELQQRLNQPHEFVRCTNILVGYEETCDYRCNGTDDQVIINEALSDLTSGRTWKELVILKGDFTCSDTIVTPNYTAIKLIGRINVANGTDANLFEFETPTTAKFIEIEGGELQGNKANNASGHAFYFDNTGYTGYDPCVWIKNMHIIGFKENGIHGIGNNSSSHLENIMVTDGDGVGYWWESNDTVFLNCISGTQGLQGFRISGAANMFSVCKAFTSGLLEVAGQTDGIVIIGFFNLFVNCYSQMNNRHGFLVYGGNAHDNTIMACHSETNAWPLTAGYGVFVDTCFYNKLIGNFIFCNQDPHTQGGVGLASCSEISILANDIHDVSGDGVDLITEVLRCLIDLNMIYECLDWGIDIANPNCVDNKIGSSNFFKNNTSGCVHDTGTDTKLPELFIYVKDPTGSIGTHPAVVLTDGFDLTVYDQISVPVSLQQLIRAQIQIVAGGSGNIRRSVETNFCKIGAAEDYNVHTDSIAADDEALVINDLSSIDISTALTGLAGGDLVGLTFTRYGSHANDTINANCYYLGIRIQYV